MAANDGSVFSAISDRLKTVYLKVVRKQFPKNQVMMMLLNRDSKKLQGGGTTAAWYLWTERNPQAGSYPDGGPFPNAGKQNGVQANTPLKNLVIPVQFEEKVLYAAESDDQSFVNEFNHEIKGGMDDFKTECARQWWAAGNNTLAVVASAAGTTVTLSTSAVPRYNPVTLYTRPNMYVTFVDAAGLSITNATNVLISAVSDTGGTLTVAGAVATAVAAAAAPVTVIKGNAAQVAGASTATLTDMQGIRSVVGTGNLYNVTVASNPSFVSYVRTTNEDPTEVMLSILKMNIVKAGPKPRVIITDPLVQAKYGNLLLSYKRTVNMTKIKGGVDITEEIDTLEGPLVAGVGPMLIDNNVSGGTNSNTAHLMMGDPSCMFIQQAGDIHWRNKDGNILRGVTGFPSYPIYQAELVWFAELCCDRRNAFALHTNVNQQT